MTSSYFDYFSQVGKEKKGGLSIRSLIILAIVLAVICGVMYGWFSFVCFRYNSQVNYLEKLKSDPGFIEQYQVHRSVSGQIDGAEKEQEYLKLLDEFALTIGTVNEKLFKTIESCLEDGTGIESIDVKQTSVTLVGGVPDVPALVRMEGNLRKCGAFSNVHIEKAEQGTGNAGKVEYICVLTLDGGAIIDEK